MYNMWFVLQYVCLRSTFYLQSQCDLKLLFGFMLLYNCIIRVHIMCCLPKENVCDDIDADSKFHVVFGITKRMC